jgi:hypothetical protein
MSSPARITEVKRHIDGTLHRFECELLLRLPHVVAVRFEHWRGRSAGPFHIPAGSVTHGFFWARRPYSLYRMRAPAGAPIADRYDIVEDVRLGEREIVYTDLFLDIWVAPGGRVIVEDEDEVEGASRAGLLSKAQVARVERAKDIVQRRHLSIVREAGRLLSRAGMG